MIVYQIENIIISYKTIYDIRSVSTMLKGVKVLDLSRVFSGPYCSQMLAELGAEVIKVEKPKKGDETRNWYPIKNKWSGYFMALNRSKKSITLNLKKKKAVEIIKKLARECDVVIENFSPSVASKLGIGYDELKKENPSIIYLSISSYGQNGNNKNKKGYDPIIQADTGIMDLTGERSGPPAKSMLPIADISSGLYGAFTVTSALYKREREGIGEYIDVSLYDSTISLMGIIAAIPFMGEDEVPKRYGSNHPHRVPSKNYLYSDGYHTHIICNNKQWMELYDELEFQKKYRNKPYNTDMGRKENRQEIDNMIQKRIINQPSNFWLERLDKRGIPCSRVNNLSQVLNSQQIKDRDMIIKWNQTDLGDTKGIGFPYKFYNTEAKIQHPVPKLGEHTHKILNQLGYDIKDIEVMESQNVI